MSYETKTWIYRGFSMLLIMVLIFLHLATLNEIGVINYNNDTPSVQQEKE